MENISKKNLFMLLALFIFLVIYLLILFFSNGGISNFNKGYILVDNLTAFYCTKTECRASELSNVDYEKNTFKEIDSSNEIKDNLKVTYDDVRFNISSNNKWLKATNEIVLFQDNLIIDPVNYSKIKLTRDDLEIINKVFDKYGFKYSSANTYVYDIFEIDINNDGVNDKIYHLSDNTRLDQKTLNYEIVFGVVNGNAYVLGVDSSLLPTSLHTFNIKSMFRMNNSNDLYVIIRRDGFSLSNDTSVSLKKISNKVVEVASYKLDNEYKKEGLV